MSTEDPTTEGTEPPSSTTEENGMIVNSIPEDLYKILGVEKDVSESDLKKAYRKLAMKWHPDKNPHRAEEAAKRFQEVAEAYDVLSDPERREIYDKYGHEGLQDGGPGDQSYATNAEEVFQKFFGGGNPFASFKFDGKPLDSRLEKPAVNKGPSVTLDLLCTLQELYNGATIKFAVTRKRFSPIGELVDESKTFVVHVRPGWRVGTRITFAGEADESTTAPPGDLIFVITAADEPQSRWMRDGQNLIYTATLTLVEALTGTTVRLMTLDGRQLVIPCPDVIAPFYEKRIPNEGMPFTKGEGRGDLRVRFHILFPRRLNNEQRTAISTAFANIPCDS